MRARWLLVGGYPAFPQAESGSEAWGNKPVDRIDNYIYVFCHKLCAGLFGGLASAAFGVAAEKKGEPGLRVGVLCFIGWCGCGFWAGAGGAVCGRCALCCLARPGFVEARPLLGVAYGSAFGCNRRACPVAGHVRVCGPAPRGGSGRSRASARGTSLSNKKGTIGSKEVRTASRKSKSNTTNEIGRKT